MVASRKFFIVDFASFIIASPWDLRKIPKMDSSDKQVWEKWQRNGNGIETRGRQRRMTHTEN